MINPNKWTKEDLISLYKGRNEEGLDFKKISEKLNKSLHSVKKQYRRVNWSSFLDSPEAYISGKGESKKWDQVEMAKLYAFCKAGKSYDFIAKEMGRSFMSIESKDQSTNWQAWEKAVGNSEAPKNIAEIENSEEAIKKLTNSLIELCRDDKDRLDEIGEEDFLRKVNLEKDEMPISFREIKKFANDYLNSLGYGNPEEMTLGEGTYIIIGDSHGKHTKTPLFHLLKEVEREVCPNRIIHVGHILDDDNDISHNMGKLKNLTIVAKVEELRVVQEQRNKYDFNYEIVRDNINLGNDLVITNQDLIGDYVKTSIGSLDSHIFEEKMIVNNHKLEWAQKCSDGEDVSYIVSPGCVCEKHKSKTVKQIDFSDGKAVKQAYVDSFSKYRRMKHMYDYWDQGFLIVHIDKSGKHTIIPCLIRKINDEVYATSYFDKIITNNGVQRPDKKIFIVADMHSPNQDNNALDIQEQICKEYKPDAFVNIGDTHDYRSLNHHEMERGRIITEDVLDESAQVYSCLKRMSTWAKEKYIIFGNHERFSNDFVARYPQLKKCLDFKFICDIDELNYKLIDLKGVLKLGPTKFIHGDLAMFGQSGNKLEKTARTFSGTVFVGHVHYPAIRFGSLSVGLSGKLDQKYNEPHASTWVHGFGLCNHYKGFSFPTTVAIINNKCIINKKIYKPVNPNSWKIVKYTAKIVYQGI